MPLLGDAGALHDGDLELAEDAAGDLTSGVGEVDVLVLHPTGVDALSHHRIGLVRHAVAQRSGLGEHTVAVGGGGGTGVEIDRVLVAAAVGLLGATGDGCGQGLRVGGAGEAGHADLCAVRHVGGGLVGRHHQVLQGRLRDAFGHGNLRVVGRSGRWAFSSLQHHEDR